MGNALRNTIRTINRLYKQADKYVFTEPVRARVLAEKAHSLATSYPFSTRALTVAEARILRVLGACYVAENQLDTALFYISQAAQLFKKTEETEEYIGAINRMNAIHWNKGRYDVALELLQSCLQWEHKVNNRQLMGQIRGNIGILFSTLGNYKQALQYLQQALLVAEECKNYKHIYKMLTNIAINYGYAGEALLALEHFLKALPVVEKYAPDKERSMGFLLMNLGNTLRLLGNYEQALEYLLHSLSLLENHGTTIEVGAALNAVGLLYHNKKEYGRAKNYLQRALAIHDGKNGAQHVRADCQGSLAHVELQLGNVDTAHHLALEAIDTSSKINNAGEKMNSLGVLAEIYKYKKEYDTARTYFQQCLDVCITCNDSENMNAKITAHIGIGDILTCQQHYEDALEYLHTARTLAEQKKGKPYLLSVYQTLANTYEQMGDTGSALKYFKLFHELDRNLFNERAEQNMQVLTMLHHVKQTERDAAAHQKDNEQLQQNIENVQKDLALHALYLARQTDLLQKTKAEIVTIANQHLPMVQKDLGSSVDILVQVLPDVSAEKVSSTSKALQCMMDKLTYIEKEALCGVQGNLSALARRLDDALLDQGMWQAFEQQFQQIHSGFMETLAQSYPQLSAAEIKVCALIKINMSSKEIGRILNISSRSVDTYRYNIRKKLGLTAKDNLIQFIVELS